MPPIDPTHDPVTPGLIGYTATAIGYLGNLAYRAPVIAASAIAGAFDYATRPGVTRRARLYARHERALQDEYRRGGSFLSDPGDCR